MPQALTETEIRNLITQVQSGDLQAFSAVYDELLPKVYRYYMSRVRRPEEAEELTSEAFLKIIKGIKSYSATGKVPFAAWVFRIVKNLLIDHYRRHKDVYELSEESAVEDPHARSSAEANQFLSRALIVKALDQLPQMQSEAISLKYLSELTNAEIAQTLQKSETAVRILLSRGLKRLSVVLEDMGADRALLGETPS